MFFYFLQVVGADYLMKIDNETTQSALNFYFEQEKRKISPELTYNGWYFMQSERYESICQTHDYLAPESKVKLHWVNATKERRKRETDAAVTQSTTKVLICAFQSALSTLFFQVISVRDARPLNFPISYWMVINLFFLGHRAAVSCEFQASCHLVADHIHLYSYFEAWSPCRKESQRNGKSHLVRS